MCVPNIKSLTGKDTRHVTVELLCGEKYDVICEVGTSGRDLFDAVATQLALPEPYLFGLTYLQDSESYFIDPDQKLSKVAPAAWKDANKHSQAPPFAVYLRVKFYVDDVSIIRHASSRHYFYLQARRDVLEDKLSCSQEQALQLAGLAMQVTT